MESLHEQCLHNEGISAHMVVDVNSDNEQWQ